MSPVLLGELLSVAMFATTICAVLMTGYPSPSRLPARR